MNRNLSRITNHANRIESIKDWTYVSMKAIGLGRQDLVDANTPKPGYGWRRIDKCTNAIQAEFGWPEVYQMRDADARTVQA
jgi:hypothetical protein